MYIYTGVTGSHLDARIAPVLLPSIFLLVSQLVFDKRNRSLVSLFRKIILDYHRTKLPKCIKYLFECEIRTSMNWWHQCHRICQDGGFLPNLYSKKFFKDIFNLEITWINIFIDYIIENMQLFCLFFSSFFYEFPFPLCL